MPRQLSSIGGERPLLNVALHTDEPQPHVHMVVKAVNERGVRLNIRKATHREWRREFAKHLRSHEVEGNATERAVRGNRIASKLDGVYRGAARRYRSKDE